MSSKDNDSEVLEDTAELVTAEADSETISEDDATTEQSSDGEEIDDDEISQESGDSESEASKPSDSESETSQHSEVPEVGSIEYQIKCQKLEPITDWAAISFQNASRNSVFGEAKPVDTSDVYQRFDRMRMKEAESQQHQTSHQQDESKPIKRVLYHPRENAMVDQQQYPHGRTNQYQHPRERMNEYHQPRGRMNEYQHPRGRTNEYQHPMERRHQYQRSRGRNYHYERSGERGRPSRPPMDRVRQPSQERIRILQRSDEAVQKPHSSEKEVKEIQPQKSQMSHESQQAESKPIGRGLHQPRENADQQQYPRGRTNQNRYSRGRPYRNQRPMGRGRPSRHPMDRVPQGSEERIQQPQRSEEVVQKPQNREEEVKEVQVQQHQMSDSQQAESRRRGLYHPRDNAVVDQQQYPRERANQYQHNRRRTYRNHRPMGRGGPSRPTIDRVQQSQRSEEEVPQRPMASDHQRSELQPSQCSEEKAPQRPMADEHRRLSEEKSSQSNRPRNSGTRKMKPSRPLFFEAVKALPPPLTPQEQGELQNLISTVSNESKAGVQKSFIKKIKSGRKASEKKEKCKAQLVKLWKQ